MKSILKKATLAISSTLITIMLISCSAPQAPTPSSAPSSSPTEAAKESAPSQATPSAQLDKGGDPIKFTVTYSDNATLPFKETWLAVEEMKKRMNADIKFEIIPINDYLTKISTMVSTNSAPDVLLYITGHKGEFPAYSLNGSIVPISDYSEWTPNFNNLVKEWNLEEDLNDIRLKDGKYYFLPSLYDEPFYDGGIVIRQDLLKKYNLETPKTYDDLYNVLKKFKEENPSSYPLTMFVGERVFFRFSMPSFGISLGENSSSGTWVLSYDYDKKEYFAGATSDEFREYVRFLSKLYAEGLLDPEFRPDGDAWAAKLATGKTMATYAYYDQLGAIEQTSQIEGFDLNLLPALEGPKGAHNQPKSRTLGGVVFPSTTAKRPDFERLVRTIDEMFFSPEMAEMFCLGVEGVTYTKNGDKIEFIDEVKNAPEGIYKALQTKYGLGNAVTQLVWKNSREMLKYDENYANINKIVSEMGNVIQPLPPSPKFDDFQAEEAALLQAPLRDSFNVWADQFITGKKSVENDWDAYVTEMKNKNIDKYVQLCNDNL